MDCGVVAIVPGGLELGAGIEFCPGSPAEPGGAGPGVWLAVEAAIFERLVIFACRRTRLLLKRGSWLLFLQLSTAR